MWRGIDNDTPVETAEETDIDEFSSKEDLGKGGRVVFGWNLIGILPGIDFRFLIYPEVPTQVRNHTYRSIFICL